MKWIFDVEDLSVSRWAKSNTSENNWGEVYRSLLQNTHTHMNTHPNLLTHSSLYPKTLQTFYGGLLNEKVVKSGSDLLLHACCLRLFVYFPSSLTHWLSLVFFPSIFFSFWLSYFPLAFLCTSIYDMLAGSWHGISQLYVFYSKTWENVTQEDIIHFFFFSVATRVQSWVIQKSLFPFVADMRWC